MVVHYGYWEGWMTLSILNIFLGVMETISNKQRYRRASYWVNTSVMNLNAESGNHEIQLRRFIRIKACLELTNLGSRWGVPSWFVIEIMAISAKLHTMLKADWSAGLRYLLTLELRKQAWDFSSRNTPRTPVLRPTATSQAIRATQFKASSVNTKPKRQART